MSETYSHITMLGSTSVEETGDLDVTELRDQSRKPRSVSWNIWRDHPTLGPLNVSRHFANNNLEPERVVELWRAQMERTGYTTRGDEYAKPYVETALDSWGN